MLLLADDNFMKTAEKVLTCNELLRLIYPLDMMLKSTAYIKRQKLKYDLFYHQLIVHNNVYET